MEFKMAETLRETANFVATKSPHGIKITCKQPGHHPKSRVIQRASTWRGLESMGDSAFDGTCVLELGIGTWKTQGPR